MAYGDSQARGLIRAIRPMPQPQQHQIRAASGTHTTAHSNAGSLTHRERPGIEPATSRFLVRFISTAPRWELPFVCFCFSLFSVPCGPSLILCMFFSLLSVPHLSSSLHLCSLSPSPASPQPAHSLCPAASLSVISCWDPCNSPKPVPLSPVSSHSLLCSHSNLSKMQIGLCPSLA